MNAHNYTTSITVDQTPGEVFKAITNVRGWWSGEIVGDTDKPGAEFTYRQQDVHRSTHKITEFVPGRKVVWHTIDSHLGFVSDGTEWNGTDLVFEISRKGKKTELQFTHIGLVPAIECYEECASAWDFYINESLQQLITTGRAQSESDE